MASWKTLLLVAVSGLGLVGVGCTDTHASNDPRRMSHIAARRSVTGSNVPQAAAYGDGVDDSSSARNSLGEMDRYSHTNMGGGLSGGATGGVR